MIAAIQIRSYLTGILVSVAGAFLWALLAFAYYGTNEGWFGPEVILVAAYGVFVSSWFVIPIGIGVGHCLPRLVVDAEPRRAVIRGILLGFGCGFLAALLTGLMEQWPILTGSVEIVDFSAWWRHKLARIGWHAVSMAIVSAA